MRIAFKQEIETSGGKASALEVHIGDKASVEAMATDAATRSAHRRPDQECCDIREPAKETISQIPVDEWDRVLHVNVTVFF